MMYIIDVIFLVILTGLAFGVIFAVGTVNFMWGLFIGSFIIIPLAMIMPIIDNIFIGNDFHKF